MDDVRYEVLGLVGSFNTDFCIQNSFRDESQMLTTIKVCPKPEIFLAGTASLQCGYTVIKYI